MPRCAQIWQPRENHTLVFVGQPFDAESYVTSLTHLDIALIGRQLFEIFAQIRSCFRWDLER